MSGLKKIIFKSGALAGLISALTVVPAASGALFDMNGKSKIGPPIDGAIAGTPSASVAGTNAARHCPHGYGGEQRAYGYVPFRCDQSRIHVNGDLADLLFGEPSSEADAEE